MNRRVVSRRSLLGAGAIVLGAPAIIRRAHAAAQTGARGFGTVLGGASTDKITTGYSTLTAGKRSYSIWWYYHGASDGSTDAGRIWSTASSQEQDALIQQRVDGRLEYSRQWSGGTGVWGFALPATGAWYHVGVAYDAGSTSNAPLMYLNGAPQSLTQSGTPVGTPNVPAAAYILGNRNDSTRDTGGALSRFTIWDGILLSALEFTALAKGVQARHIEPAARVVDIPIWGVSSPEIDLISTNGTASVTGTAAYNGPLATFFTPGTP